MRTPALLTFVFAATTLAACGGQGTADSLVGTWTRLRADSTEMRDRFTFSADGTMTFDENKPDARADEDHLTGTYTASDREVGHKPAGVFWSGSADVKESVGHGLHRR